jgi:hypothetical protein
VPKFQRTQNRSHLFIMEDSKSPLPVVDIEQSSLKINFISVLQMKSSSTYLIPTSLCEGPFFYFYVESLSSNFKALLESIAVILSVMCVSQNTVNCGITLMLISLIFLLLFFLWTSEVPQHLCFALQIKASWIPLFHIIYAYHNLVASYVHVTCY